MSESGKCLHLLFNPDLQLLLRCTWLYVVLERSLLVKVNFSTLNRCCCHCGASGTTIQLKCLLERWEMGSWSSQRWAACISCPSRGSIPSPGHRTFSIWILCLEVIFCPMGRSASPWGKGSSPHPEAIWSFCLRAPLHFCPFKRGNEKI